MLKKGLPVFVVLLLTFLWTVNSHACVGRTLYVGTLDTTEDKVLAQMLVLLINERTGTTVKIRYFDDNTALYNALKENDEEKRADIIVENTNDALALLKKSSPGDLDQTYRQVKELYESELGLIWLNPFGFKHGAGAELQALSAPLVRRDVLTNYPLLPRVLNKLAGAITDETFANLTAKVKDGEKPMNVSKDFLRAKKFI
ncbi:MAG: glycine betaine ABC transporter substrate-binding protein [Desulfobulbales bacterium]|nr:glycine betaine ABC transporter substrate-binding protein [Desulfobulbales bacterium]